MQSELDEEKLLHSVALQNASSILYARQRAEQELIQAKDALERRTKELAHSLAMMRATLESSTDGILATDGRGHVTSFNARFVEMWRLPRELIDCRDHARILEAMGQQFENARQYRTRVMDIYAAAPAESYDLLELRDGRFIERYSHLQFVEGKNVGRVWSFHDITEHRRAEAALREADRRKDEFIAMLAHELRNPLAPLRNGLQVIRLEGGETEKIAAARTVMERQLDHMIRLIDDLLDISRINRNVLELRLAPVLLADVVASAVETVQPLIAAAGHELDVSLPLESLQLNADLVRLAQVFGNLLSNSVKYTPPGGRIGLTATRHGNRVIVTVRDSGIGITADHLPHIFDMFSQVERNEKRGTNGLGLGLALVKNLVELHGGTVSAASAGVGRGSTLTVALPILECQPQPVSPKEPIPAEAMSRTKRHILVVDDNRDSAVSMAMMLELLGNEVRTAHDGLAAVEAAEQFRPDVVLMDVGMPRLDGYEATRRIRQTPWGKDIVVIALTGWGQESDRQRSRDAGCNGHLVKPASLPDLQKCIAEFTSK